MLSSEILQGEMLQLTLRWSAAAALLAVLLAICISDIRRRRIPNKWVLTGLAVALVWHGIAIGGQGMFDRYGFGGIGVGRAALGAAIGFGAFLLLHVIRMMGAGDVKLMAMLGATFGPAALPQLLLAIFLATGALVAVRLINAPRRRAAFANLRWILFAQMASTGGGMGPRFDPRTDTADRLPFAVPMAIGAVLLATGQLAGFAGLSG